MNKRSPRKSKSKAKGSILQSLPTEDPVVVPAGVEDLVGKILSRHAKSSSGSSSSCGVNDIVTGEESGGEALCG